MPRKTAVYEKSAMYIALKELSLFFSSPIAYLFLGVFVAVTLFIFFWWESYFARNIADIRPLFEWMPVLLILLSSALTMRMWSEERRSGTLEHVITLPVSTWQFVIGKFIACELLLIIALLLTLPLPITVSFIGNLDWGPVISGYLATVLLGSAYLAIGLFVSSRSDNQIVSLILTILLCSLFYLIGSTVITDLVNNQTGEFLREIGSGSRFESITRGVLDIRDFYYYISIAVVFLVLNRYSLERDRWAADGDRQHHRRWNVFALLVLVNILAFNFVLAPINSLRIDTTQGNIYSISDATRGYLKQLEEPLLIRGYFSAKTHPLLAPLVPEVQDLLKEYAAESDGNILVEIIDPASNPDAEEEAGSKYGIRPVPFRIADRYETSVVNSYFNILVLYGDEYKTISFEDMIEVKARSEDDIEVRLRNPEYDITNAIKQVLYAYQSGGNLFDSTEGEVHLTAYISPDARLPETLVDYNKTLREVLAENVAKSSGKFTFEFIDPDANGGKVAQEIAEAYGFQPMASSLFDTNTFYYHLVLANGNLAMQLPQPDEFTKEATERVLDAGLKRFARGFTKNIGVSAPKQNQFAVQMGQSSSISFESVQAAINENMSAKPADLSSGKISDETDLLMALAPNNLDDKSLFAIDQFLMRGGTVLLATAPYQANVERQMMSAREHKSNLEAWLQHNGINIEKSLIMDTQNTPFPVPVARQVGAFSVREISLIDYPFFIEAREDDLNRNNPVTSGLQQLTIPWASPIKIDSEKNANRKVVELAKSSPESWLTDSPDINPRLKEDGTRGFEVGDFVGSQLVAAAITGRFESYFADRESPLLKVEEKDDDEKAADDNEEANKEVITGTIEHSPESSRLILISSNSFAEDNVLRLQSSTAGNNYINPLQFIVNATEWSLDDEGLLSIRSRGHFNRTLPPLADEARQFWEGLNYVLAIAALLVVYLAVYWRRSANRARYQQLLGTLVLDKQNNDSEKGVTA